MSIRAKVGKFIAEKIERKAEKELKANKILWGYLEYYRRLSTSTGCSYSDYWLLYRYIKKHRPKEVLECGTGVSTVVIARALQENQENFGIQWRLVSMEENRDWFDMAIKALPPNLKNDPRLEICFSEAVEDAYECFRGVRYKEIPRGNYEFVFIDGPDFMTNPAKKPLTFDYDFVKLVSESEHPISALIDTRTSTCFIYSLLFPNKFRYDYLRKVGIVYPVTKADLADTKQIVARAMSSHSFRRPPIWQAIKGEY